MPADAPSTSLPPLVAAPVSAESRLAYVLRHFRLAYENVPAVAIGYGGSQAAIEVIDGAGDFFSQSLPYPAAPTARAWRGQSVPFFFDARPGAPLLDVQNGRVTITTDIIGAAFYLLSGWQEYFSDARDRHGRFPYAASVQQRYGFVTLSVVNYYFDVLKTAVEHVSGQPLRPRRWGAGQSAFAAFVSHDVDNLRSSWKAPAKDALRTGRLGTFGKLLWNRFRAPDAWDNLEQVAAATARYGEGSTFFLLPQHRPAPDGTPNADYRLDTGLWQRLRRLQQQGCELGLHGSIGTSIDANRLRSENTETRAQTAGGIRFHYLRWEPRLTAARLDAEGFAFDSTLGFAEHFGFRNSCCLPFFPFNFATGEAHRFLEIPLVVMDATLHHPNYLQLAPDEILPAIAPVFAETEHFGGVVSVLWHNENFDPANRNTGPHQFHEIMGDLSRRGAAFLTGSEICRRFLA